MFRHNLPFKKISLLAATCGGLLVSLATLGQAGGPPPQPGKPVSQPAATPAPGKPVSEPSPAASPSPATSPKPSGMPATPQDAPARFPMPSARVTPMEGMVVIKLVNTTNAVINYQVIGVTPPRTLGEQSEILLKNIKVPITFTYQRPDGGLLLVRPQATATPGMLQVSFGATTDLGVDTKSMEIQEDGKVILN
ncbi:MAG: hypothetical protein JGK08_23285 [Microcoleus sp. PH2017_04_SCI_O_A]|uniref:hypothetical protein n=1 Tax=unclassified Microcoleus TaxID=2642155 RepID=UPI001D88BD84|nr:MULTISPECIES: hypothetical protein [unclassified Microcoleus]MCC3432814.1 hypothetical protein [Microcoleus sp. PH2017_04_SCI_O_A]TAF94362.1 MAG: hypothetical protein EAZ45_27650 [Oscillatoriales cyanobacterium]MCC3569305.1 hypothetical protein [Microcoleus sp. PH2017_31_RDM_U_A]MCC3580925.1 hypothetical protein [Microcoleus sp. PH2017_32_RDM_D_A]MCC3619006.1 hypothetical protein [Microcoleus sp. PH2017_38_RDM_U_B]